MSAVRVLAEERLSELLGGHVDQVPIVPFPAVLSDQRPVIVTAVLERTAVVQVGRVEDKIVVRLDLVWVDPLTLRWIDASRYAYSTQLVDIKSSRRGRVMAMRNRYGEKAAERTELAQKLRAQGQARCSRCGFVGSRLEFNANRYCKSCAAEVNKTYRQKESTNA